MTTRLELALITPLAHAVNAIVTLAELAETAVFLVRRGLRA